MRPEIHKVEVVSVALDRLPEQTAVRVKQYALLFLCRRDNVPCPNFVREQVCEVAEIEGIVLRGAGCALFGREILVDKPVFVDHLDPIRIQGAEMGELRVGQKAGYSSAYNVMMLGSKGYFLKNELCKFN